jgi:hypothetical protein
VPAVAAVVDTSRLDLGGGTINICTSEYTPSESALHRPLQSFQPVLATCTSHTSHLPSCLQLSSVSTVNPLNTAG